jgi:hypothetical protein
MIVFFRRGYLRFVKHFINNCLANRYGTNTHCVAMTRYRILILHSSFTVDEASNRK